MADRMFCENCRQVFHDGEIDCPNCEDEPLLDLDDPDIRQFLRDMDDHDRDKKMRRFTLVAIVVCLPILGLYSVVDFTQSTSYRGRSSLTLWPLGLYVLAVLGLSAGLLIAFPAKKRLR